MSCSPRINSFKNVDVNIHWSPELIYRTSATVNQYVYYVDSVPYSEKMHFIYSDESNYTYMYMSDSLDISNVKEEDVLFKNLANLVIRHISNEIRLPDSLSNKLFGNDSFDNSKMNFGESNKYGMCMAEYKKVPSHFRILLIRGDFLNCELHYFIQDGRFSKEPVQIIDPYAFYKVYVPIWE
jgi:hypothetical protein